MKTFLAFLDAYISGELTLSVSNARFKGTTANYLGTRIKKAARIRRDMFASFTTFGRSRIGYGELELVNNAEVHDEEGALDYLLDYAFDGRAFQQWYAEGANGAVPTYPADFTQVIEATMTNLELSRTRAIVKLRDKQAELDVPIQTNKYAGDNSLPGGLEGGEDLKGKPKPLCFGQVFNVPAVCVNTSKLIYQVNDGAVDSIDAVRDRGQQLGETTLTWEELQELDVYLNYTEFFVAAYSSPLGRWVMGRNQVWVSDDAVTWLPFWPPPVAAGSIITGFEGLIWGRGIFVGVGTAGAIMTSPNGEIWTEETSPFSTAEKVGGVAYSPSLDLYVVGGTSGKIYSSPDAATWTAESSPLSNTVEDIEWSESQQLFVAVTLNGEIATSPDGETWTAQSSALGSANLHAVAYSEDLDLWVAGGASTSVQTSPDGESWTSRSITRSGGTWDIAWTPWGFFLMTGGLGETFISSNGTTWTELANDFGSSEINAVAVSESRVVICGDDKKVARNKKNVAKVYASEADLLDDTQAPAPGTWGYYLAGGLIRLGSTPDGAVTADVVQGDTASDRTAAQIFVGVFDKLGKSGAYDADDITDLDSDNSAVCGIWLGPEEHRASDVLDAVANTVGAWWGVDRLGIFRIKRLNDPAGESAGVTLRARDMVKPLERRESNDEGRGIPTWRTTIRYRRNYFPQTTDLADALTQVERANLGRPWKQDPHEDSSVQTVHLLAREHSFDSLFQNLADAAAESSRRQTLRGVKRDIFETAITMTADHLAIDLGDYIEIIHPRFGLSAGKNFAVIMVEPVHEPDKSYINLGVWG